MLQKVKPNQCPSLLSPKMRHFVCRWRLQLSNMFYSHFERKVSRVAADRILCSSHNKFSQRIARRAISDNGLPVLFAWLPFFVNFEKSLRDFTSCIVIPCYFSLFLSAWFLISQDIRWIYFLIFLVFYLMFTLCSMNAANWQNRMWNATSVSYCSHPL